MERETKTLELPVTKAKVVIYTYLTGREFEQVQAPLLQAMAMSPEGQGKNVKFGNIDVAKVQESTHLLVEKHVVSVNGNKDKVLDQILDMPNEDYQFVVESIQELSKKN